MTRFLHRTRSQRGATLMEMLVVVGVMGIVGATGAAQMAHVRRAMQGDGAMRLVMSEFNTAREMAVTQRRYMEVKFIGSDWIQVIRHEVPAGTTTLLSHRLEGSVTFRIVPSITLDTPDGFGNSTPIAFGTATTYTFSSDGTLIDQSGNPLNGTVFLAMVNVPQSQRAVTILGATGRVRGYKWNGSGWKRV